MRDLTKEEKAEIRRQKDKANAHYNAVRKSLTEQLLQASKGQRGYVTERMRQLERNRNAVPKVVGTPVYFDVDGERTLLNYDQIKKALSLTKNLKRVVSLDGLYLEITYEGKGVRGKYEFLQLPDYYTLLEGLSTIELEGVYF